MSLSLKAVIMVLPASGFPDRNQLFAGKESGKGAGDYIASTGGTNEIRDKVHGGAIRVFIGFLGDPRHAKARSGDGSNRPRRFRKRQLQIPGIPPAG